MSAFNEAREQAKKPTQCILRKSTKSAYVPFLIYRDPVPAPVPKPSVARRISFADAPQPPATLATTPYTETSAQSVNEHGKRVVTTIITYTPPHNNHLSPHASTTDTDEATGVTTQKRFRYRPLPNGNVVCVSMTIIKTYP